MVRRNINVAARYHEFVIARFAGNWLVRRARGVPPVAES
jgi:hypothetical protein